MKKEKTLIFLLMLLFIFPFRIYAEECTENQKQYLKTLYENIKLDYEYVETNNDDIKGVTDNYFKVKITNLPKEITAYSNYNEKSYMNISNNNLDNIDTDNVLGGNKVVFSFETNENIGCDLYLGTKEISVPFYNSYQNDDLCKDKEDSEYCQEFLEERISYEEFKDEISKYKNVENTDNSNKEDNITETQQQPINKTIFIIFSIFIIIFFVISIIFITIKKKKLNKKILLFSFFLLCFIIGPKLTNAQIRYDITNLKISDEKIDFSGWGIIQWEDNGKIEDKGSGYSPNYKFEIYSDSGEVIDTENFHYDNLPNNREMFSVTCYNSFGSDFNECISYEKTNLTERNKLIESLDSNKERYRWFYDNVDFKVSFNIKDKLETNKNYYIRMIIELNNGTTETMDKLYVRNDSNIITNTSSTLNLDDFFNSDYDNAINVVAGSAKTRDYKNTSIDLNVGFGSDTCTFKNQTYSVDSYKSILDKPNAKLYIYKLKTDLSSFNDTCTNTLQNLNNVGAYASWVVPSGNSAITLKLKTCNDLDYAVSNLGKCCDTYKETCCGNSDYIQELYKENPNDNLFTSEYCCNTSDKYTPNNEVWENYSVPTFSYYLTNKLPDDYLYNNKKYYDQEFINNICAIETPKEDDKCTSESEYKLGNECCLANPDKYPEICDYTPTDNNTCTDNNYFKENKTECCKDSKSTFFKNNRSVCCQLSNHKDKSYCNGDDGDEPIVYDNPNAACKKQDTSSFTLNSKVNAYNNAACKIDIVSDKITFSEYKDNVNLINNSGVKAGMGFSFDIKISNDYTYQIDLDYMKDYFENNDFSKDEVNNKLVSCINILNSLNKNEESYKNIITNNNQKFYLQKTNPDEEVPFSISSDIVRTKSEKSTNTDNFQLRYLYGKEVCTSYSNGNRWSITDEGCSNIGEERNVYKYITYLPSSTQIKFSNTFEYTISPNEYYIDKLNEEDNFYKNNEIITTEELKNLMGGNRLVTTHTYDEIGYRNFYIKFEKGGITGSLTSKINNKESFDCQYKVMNQFKGQTIIDGPADGKPFYYFRPISLTTPFPNNRYQNLSPNSNWYGTVENTNKTKEEYYITDKGDSVYSEPIFSVKLTNELIQKIRNYNDEQEASGGYLDMTTMKCNIFNVDDCQSTFLDQYFSGNDFSKLRGDN